MDQTFTCSDSTALAEFLSLRYCAASISAGVSLSGYVFCSAWALRRHWSPYTIQHNRSVKALYWHWSPHITPHNRSGHFTSIGFPTPHSTQQVWTFYQHLSPYTTPQQIWVFRWYSSSCTTYHTTGFETSHAWVSLHHTTQQVQVQQHNAQFQSVIKILLWSGMNSRLASQ